MTSRHLKIVLGLMAPLALLLTACADVSTEDSTSSAEETSVVSSTPGETAGSDENQSQLAPPVSAPVDAAGLEPCELMSDGAATSAGYDPDSKELRPNHSLDEAPLDMCRWLSNDVGSVTLNASSVPEGLSTVYANYSNYVVFEPRTVGEYPAVHTNDVEDSARCPLFVGIADDQVLLVDALTGPTDDACQIATEVAQAIMNELPPAAQEQ
ncbi:DUF3558 domain-containing protein [Actinoalloteichus sp. AHMU CJ021]|uniref:DUF3558 domain-containing protein n=1 Tax=Actinoalloteichus TaxID=65496 RepID=UPI0009DDAF49|nr:DUF3558 domain-containing protein [Actinoalloteichus caeruleus]AUS81230.1 DUF3558 domain-containing protein [Actinoalloteichus sp. AHMU CJ021]